MMSQIDYLNTLAGLIRENGLPEANVDKLREIDDAVEGRRDKLIAILQRLEADHGSKLKFNNHEVFNGYDGTEFAPFPAHNEGSFKDRPGLEALHSSRVAAVRNIFAEDNVVIDEGGVKSFERAKIKLDRRKELGRPDHAPDLSRMRIVVPDLETLELAHDKLLAEMPFIQIGNFNHYLPYVTGRKYPTHFRGLLTNWAEDGGGQYDRISTEVQLVTENVAAVMALDHPFNVAQSIQYPGEPYKDYVDCLMLKASILDYKRRFGK